MLEFDLSEVGICWKLAQSKVFHCWPMLFAFSYPEVQTWSKDEPWKNPGRTLIPAKHLLKPSQTQNQKHPPRDLQSSKYFNGSKTHPFLTPLAPAKEQQPWAGLAPPHLEAKPRTGRSTSSPPSAATWEELGRNEVEDPSWKGLFQSSFYFLQ